MENSGTGDKELLVAGSNQRCRKVCGRMRFMLEDEEQNRRTGGKAEVE